MLSSSTSKREVLSLLRRCMALPHNTQALPHNTQALLHNGGTDHNGGTGGGSAVMWLAEVMQHDAVLTALDMLPSYDTSSITEAVAEIVENRLIPKMSPTLRGSTLTRRSQRRAVDAVLSGSFDGKPPPHLVFGKSPSSLVAAGGGGSLGTTPERSPFGRSLEGGNDATLTTMPTRVVDSALYTEEEQAILAEVLRRGLLAAERATRSAVQDVLLVTLVDQHAPSLFARQNAGVLFGKLVACGFFDTAVPSSPPLQPLASAPDDDKKKKKSLAATGAVDPFERLYDVFSGTRSGVVAPDQCLSILAVLHTPIPNGGTSGGAHATLAQQHAHSPYRSMLLDLLCRTQAFQVAAVVGRVHDASATIFTGVCDVGDGVTIGDWSSGAMSLEAQRNLYDPVWLLYDLLQPISDTAPCPDACPAGVGEKTICVPPPCAIGATPPSEGAPFSSSESGGHHGSTVPPPPPYDLQQRRLEHREDDAPLPPPSYQLHMSHNGRRSKNEPMEGRMDSSSEAGGSGMESKRRGAAAAGGRAPPEQGDGRGEVFQPAPPTAHFLRQHQSKQETSTRDSSDVSLEQHVALQRLMLTAAQREEAKIRTVYINKLDPRTTESQLRDFLDQCGQVLRVRLCGELVGRTKYGFVEYSKADAARLLIAKDREMLGNCAIRCSLAKQPIQDVDPQFDAVIDPKRGLTRACLFGFVRRQGLPNAPPQGDAVFNQSNSQRSHRDPTRSQQGAAPLREEKKALDSPQGGRTVLGGLRIAGVST